MRLEDIGFYTLNDERARTATGTSRMQRCELILTDLCNFSCPYCRGLREDCVGTMPLPVALKIIRGWKTKNIRFSGGEPMLYPWLNECVERAIHFGSERVAISTNGSFSTSRYVELIKLGVNDFSISLDACCAGDARTMSGGAGDIKMIEQNIKVLSAMAYVSVGIVVTEDTLSGLPDTVEFAHSLGVDDIRIISAAQWDDVLETAKKIPQNILDAHPILSYRVSHINSGRNVRGLQPEDNDRCPIVLDDSVVAGLWHFPCVIYMREGGEPIGKVGPNMREERVEWSQTHDTHLDPICSANCLDVCIDYNNRWRDLRDEEANH